MGALSIIGGLVTLAVGILLWVAFASASAFRSAFGGDEIGVWWYAIPAGITFGGPAWFWGLLPARLRRRRERERGAGHD